MAKQGWREMATYTIDSKQAASLGKYLAAGHTVVLRPGIYTITNTIRMGQGSSLTGPRTAIIHVRTNLDKETAVFEGHNVSNITIDGFTIDGNRGRTGGQLGRSFNRLFLFTNCRNLKIFNTRMQHGQTDFIKCRNCVGVEVLDNDFYLSGHESGYFINCDDVHIERNRSSNRMNSGFRFSGRTRNIMVIDNDIDGTVITGYGSFSGPGLEIDNKSAEVSNVLIENNRINNTQGSGIRLQSSALSDLSRNIVIRNNTLKNCGSLNMKNCQASGNR